MLNWAGIGAGALAIAVMLGAFGAHGLRGRLDAYAMDVYQRAVFYHFIHAFGLLVTPLFVRAGLLSPPAGNRIAAAFLIGILLFSGSLYALVISGVRVLGAITPFGGVAFIAAWTLLAIGLLRKPNP
jgi:uncharacterized membrane protein YgdD (TMEM256/DUF423 family)